MKCARVEEEALIQVHFCEHGFGAKVLVSSGSMCVVVVSRAR